MTWTKGEIRYYNYCLQTNPTNNRYPGSTARAAAGPLGWTIARSISRQPDKTCRLNGTPHRGPTALYHYTDYQGQQFSQYFCTAHVPRRWVPGRKQDGTYPHYEYYRGQRRYLRHRKEDDTMTFPGRENG